jgi:hypothetical protein
LKKTSRKEHDHIPTVLEAGTMWLAAHHRQIQGNDLSGDEDNMTGHDVISGGDE